MLDILMATYNGERYLHEQINSIRNQKYKDWNLFISDDGSSDNTRYVIDEESAVDNRIHVVRTGIKHGNPKYHFLDLLSYSSSDYFAFCDQDDYWLSNKLSASMELMHQLEESYGKEQPLLVYGDMKVVDEQLNVICDSFFAYSGFRTGVDFSYLLTSNTAAGCTIIGNKALRDLVELSKPYFNDSRIMMHDWWLMLVAAAFGAIGLVSKSCVMYRQHEINSVGARHYSILNIPDRIVHFRRSANVYWSTVKQAELFYQIYGTMLSSGDNHKITTYIASASENRFSAIRNLWKEKLLKRKAMQRILQVAIILFR